MSLGARHQGSARFAITRRRQHSGIVSLIACIARRSPPVYQPGREEQHLYRLTLINDLRCAIPNNKLSVHYQPKVKLDTGKVTHVEALMRWHHPRCGMVCPEEFIPLAEHAGRIRQLTA